jgi:hypothetical protein
MRMIEYCYLSSLVKSKFLERVRVVIRFGVVGRVDFGGDVRRELGFRIIQFRHGNGGG